MDCRVLDNGGPKPASSSPLVNQRKGAVPFLKPDSWYSREAAIQTDTRRHRRGLLHLEAERLSAVYDAVHGGVRPCFLPEAG